VHEAEAAKFAIYNLEEDIGENTDVSESFRRFGDSS